MPTKGSGLASGTGAQLCPSTCRPLWALACLREGRVRGVEPAGKVISVLVVCGLEGVCVGSELQLGWSHCQCLPEARERRGACEARPWRCLGERGADTCRQESVALQRGRQSGVLMGDPPQAWAQKQVPGSPSPLPPSASL